MDLIFRDLPKDSSAIVLEAGDVMVRAPSTGVEHGLAALVLANGVDALLQGPGPGQRLIVDVGFTSPTLDDMLAASFARRLLLGQPVPAGCADFAHYAAQVRQGKTPTDFKPQDTLEGIFQAVRNPRVGANLTRPEVEAKFREGWQRLEECIFKAAATGVNPFTTSLFTGSAAGAFADERAFLIRDEQVYRQDVERGQRWRVRLPLPGQARAAGLLLRKPQSKCFAYWSRRDDKAPLGGCYLFLAVDWGDGVWVFSTDPIQHLNLESLQKVFQKKEAARNPTRAAANPWVVKFAGSMVAAPRKETETGAPAERGTALADRAVLHTARKWAQASTVGTRWPIGQMAAALGGVLAIALLVLIYLRPGPLPAPQRHVAVSMNGRRVPSEVRFDEATKQPKQTTFKIEELGPGAAAAATIEVPSFDEPYDVPHAVRCWLTIRAVGKNKDPLPTAGASLQFNGAAPGTILTRRPRSADGEAQWDPACGVFQKGKNTLTVALANTGSEFPRQLEFVVEWQPVPKLYLLAVGVGTYLHLPDKDHLKFPPKDAQALADAFQKQGGKDGPFAAVEATVLAEAKATRAAILEKLKEISRKASVYDLVAVTLAGHGKVNDKEFLFCPVEYESEKEWTAVRWPELEASLLKMPCKLLVVVDACHSGGVTLGSALRDGGHGGIVLAASLRQQKAKEYEDWKHGALTLAVLEGLQGQHLYKDLPGTVALPHCQASADEFVKLSHLAHYVQNRVYALDRELRPETAQGQSVVVLSVNQSQSDPQDIVIARKPLPSEAPCAK